AGQERKARCQCNFSEEIMREGHRETEESAVVRGEWIVGISQQQQGDEEKRCKQEPRSKEAVHARQQGAAGEEDDSTPEQQAEKWRGLGEFGGGRFEKLPIKKRPDGRRKEPENSQGPITAISQEHGQPEAISHQESRAVG